METNKSNPKKEAIYKFLKDNIGKRFSQKELERKLNISYPIILKWVNVLEVEKDRKPSVKIEQHGMVKLIYAE